MEGVNALMSPVTFVVLTLAVLVGSLLARVAWGWLPSRITGTEDARSLMNKARSISGAIRNLAIGQPPEDKTDAELEAELIEIDRMLERNENASRRRREAYMRLVEAGKIRRRPMLPFPIAAVPLPSTDDEPTDPRH